MGWEWSPELNYNFSFNVFPPRAYQKIQLLIQAALDRHTSSPKARWEAFSSSFLEIYNKPLWDMMLGKEECGMQQEI